MPPLLADHDRIAAAAGERLGHGRGRIEALAVLVERRHGEVDAQPHSAGVGGERAGERLISVVLPLPLGPTMPMRSPRWMRMEKSATIGRPSYDLPTRSASITSLPDWSAVAAASAALPAVGAVAAARLPQRLQGAEPADIALAPRGDAVAQPVLLGDDLAVELVLVALFLGQDLVPPCLETGEAALDAAGLAAVEPDRAAGQVRQEPPVVADHDQRGAAAGKLALEPFDRGEVEMIGGLVEQQDVGSGREHARERRPPRLAARQARRVLAAVEAELLQQEARLVMIVARSEPGLNVGERRRRAGEIGLLRQVAHGGARLHEAGAAVGLDQPGGDLEQGRLARSVAANQAHALAGRDRELDAGQAAACRRM